MEFQFIGILLAFIAITKAHPSSVVAPVAAPVAVAARLVDSEYDPIPQYSFAYDVHDSLTGDSKSQTESRNGDIVQGQYTVADPDGTRRIVDYTADSINGFNAIVSKAPLAVAAPLVARAAPIVAAPAKLVAAPARVVATPARVVAAAAPLVAAAAPVANVFASRFAYAPAAPARLAYTAAAPFAAPVAAPIAAPLSAPFAYPAAAAPLAYPAVSSLAAPYSVAKVGFASPYAVY